MKLLTVTCDRDFAETILQARSIEKFLTNTFHLIIVNQSKIDSRIWIESLSHFYKNNQLELIFKNDFLEHDGYVTQQYWKLKAVEILQDNYIVLDAKNFFIKSTDITEWTQHGSGRVHAVYEEDYSTLPFKGLLYLRTMCKNTMQIYCDQLSVSFLSEYYHIVTPFVMKKEIAEEANIHKHILFEKHMPMEFMLYNVILHKNNFKFVNSRVDWTNNGKAHLFLFPHMFPTENAIASITISRDIMMSGIHRLWLKTATNNDRQCMYKWLESLEILVPEFTTKLMYL